MLVRLKNGRVTPMLAQYRDGSYLSVLGGVPVRVIDCQITLTTTAGQHTGSYRLATTLRDHRRYPAADLIRLYHQRWEIETAYLEIKSTILGGRVLRARTPEGITQEIYALLVTYQLLRTAMADATAPVRAPTGPGQLHHRLARRPRQITHAANIIAGTVTDLAGTSAGTSWPACYPPGGCGPAPHRQTSHLQIPGPRPQHRPHQLQNHHQHRHPGTRYETRKHRASPAERDWWERS